MSSDAENKPAECREVQRLLVLYVADELDPAERAELEDHLQHCPACAAEAAPLRRLLEAAAEARVVPPPSLLAECRSELNDSLDRLEDRGWSRLFRPRVWFGMHPALNGALLVLLGLALGSQLPRWLRPQPPATAHGTSLAPVGAGVVTPAALAPEDLRNADVAGISWVPGTDNQPPQIEVHITREQPLDVKGTVDDSDVLRLLLYAVRNAQRIDPGVRLDSVELLKNRAGDAEVRRALCHAAVSDPNPGVRLKAIEALAGSTPDADVRHTLVAALVTDKNPGVRIEAINALHQMAEQGEPLSDPQLLEALRERMQKDPSTYIRSQSAAVIHELGPKENY